MAFFADRPISMIKPIWTYTAFCRLRTKSPRNAPSTATGSGRNTLNGSVQLSYCAARMRNTTRSDTPKTTLGGTPCSDTCSWYERPR